MPRKLWTFDSARREAEAFAQNAERVRHLLRDAGEKARRNRGKLEEFWEGLSVLMRLVGAWVSGKYATAPWRTIVFAIAAILYFVNPLDLIPDVLPFAGFIDDAGVVALVLDAIRKDLGAFLEWERSNPTGEGT